LLNAPELRKNCKKYVAIERINSSMEENVQRLKNNLCFVFYKINILQSEKKRKEKMKTLYSFFYEK